MFTMKWVYMGAGETLGKIIELIGAKSGVTIGNFEKVVSLNEKFMPVIVDHARQLRVKIASNSLVEAEKEMAELIRIGKMGR